ncbi:hypothetical protein [Desulfonatronovibrio hydrogenovorans]|uniref:hypothetical protein n=1 Tax=Desulfonatronovibrio hydrogenovorans TaxID=53245 RepID=UPI00048A8B52|nr:hypothetical protein [Desulfonatronovibrio hydrogenovorans]
MSSKNKPGTWLCGRQELQIFKAVQAERVRAENIHPDWPDDPVHAAGIVAEEAGELIRAANRFYYEGKPLEDMRKEAIQTAATCLRFLAATSSYRRKEDA